MNNRHLKPYRKISLNHRRGCWVGSFPAMASDCEIQFVGLGHGRAEQLTLLAASECWRIQDKFSRYQADSVVSGINNAGGKPVAVDVETAALIDYAFHCYRLSNGLFDITSGVLGKVWRFDGSDRLPDMQAVRALLPAVGLNKVQWRDRTIQMPAGMELDFGGIGKEYAVDKVMQLFSRQVDSPVLLNFGGDFAANKPPAEGRGWYIGVADVANDLSGKSTMAFQRGGLATSGDVRRYLLKDGIRYSHILNPKTGWPVQQAPRSVTVIADTCADAGILATLAMLRGRSAEAFLREQKVRYYCQR